MAKHESISCDCGCGQPVRGKASLVVEGAVINCDLDLCEEALRKMARVVEAAFRVGAALDKQNATASARAS